jgi:hypothetical protein
MRIFSLIICAILSVTAGCGPASQGPKPKTTPQDKTYTNYLLDTLSAATTPKEQEIAIVSLRYQSDRLRGLLWCISCDKNGAPLPFSGEASFTTTEYFLKYETSAEIGSRVVIVRPSTFTLYTVATIRYPD